MAAFVTSLISSSSGTLGQCCCRTDRQNSLTSHWTVTSNPLRSKPRSIPPMPEKNDASVGLFIRFLDVGLQIQGPAADPLRVCIPRQPPESIQTPGET